MAPLVTLTRQFVYCKFQTGEVFLLGAAMFVSAPCLSETGLEVRIYRDVTPQGHRLQHYLTSVGFWDLFCLKYHWSECLILILRFNH